MRHARPLAVGLNCALGAALMRPYIEELAKVAGDTFISCYPNAGLPNPMSETGFDETPEVTGALMEELRAKRLPEHRRRLLWHDAGTHCRHCPTGGWLPAARSPRSLADRVVGGLRSTAPQGFRNLRTRNTLTPTMTPMNSRLERPAGTLSTVFSAILGWLVMFAGALLMVGVLFIGLLLGLALMLFALLRGRKPQRMKFVWRKGEWPGRPGAWRDRHGVTPGEVVDIEAREVAPRPKQGS